MSSIPSNVQKSMSQYCALSRDELLLEEKCDEQLKHFNEVLANYKMSLSDFLGSQDQSCVPVSVDMDGSEHKVFLRSVVKSSYKTVNEDAFKKVIEHIPTVEELTKVYEDLNTPKASLSSVYAAWIFNKLYHQNVTKKTVFEISDKPPRTSKNSKKQKMNEGPPIPTNVAQTVVDWIKMQHNIKRLKQFKKENITKLNTEKKLVESDVETFLSARSGDKQEQKISMSMHGETKPFILKRVIEKRSPTLTISKAKPLVADTVISVLSRMDSSYETPFNPATTRDLLARQTETRSLLPNLLFSEFRVKVEEYKKSGMKVSSRIELREKTNRTKQKRKSVKNNNNNNNIIEEEVEEVEEIEEVEEKEKRRNYEYDDESE